MRLASCNPQYTLCARTSDGVILALTTCAARRICLVVVIWVQHMPAVNIESTLSSSCV